AGAAWLDAEGWLPNTGNGRERALDRLDGLLLEGATDLSAALDALSSPPLKVGRGTPRRRFPLSDRPLTRARAAVAGRAARVEPRCPLRAGWECEGSGRGEENAELYEALTRRGGGVFQCFRDADVAAASKAHQSQCLEVREVRFTGGPAASDVLVAGRRAAVY